MKWFWGPAVPLIAAGCFSTPPMPPVDFRGFTDGPDPCLLGGGMLVGGRSVSVGLSTLINPDHAPIPSNASESFVFGHMFDALVRLDCFGRVGPGLATTWRPFDNGRRWLFEIDTSRTFWGGGVVNASIVRDALQQNRVAVPQGVRPSLVGVVFSALDAVTLEVRLPHPASSSSLFADAVFAVRKGNEGTGAYALETSASGDLRLRSRDAMLPDLTFQINEDGRDLVDARADLLATTDAAVARYAKSRRDFDAYPLKWSVRYVLLANDGFPQLAGTPDFRDRLALEAVRADARGAEGTGWWESIRFCPVSPQTSRRMEQGQPRTILYADTDPVARDLAQRIAAMSRRSARGLPVVALEAAVREGTGAAVFALPIDFPAPCLLSAEWLTALRSYRIDPLVDVRAHLVKAFLGPGAFAAYDGGFEFRMSRSSNER